MEVCCMTQGTQPGVPNNLEWWEGEEKGGRFKREGACVYLWLIHTDVWQKLTQLCTATSLQLKKINVKPKKKRKEKKKKISRKNVQYKLTLRSESKWHN